MDSRLLSDPIVSKRKDPSLTVRLVVRDYLRAIISVSMVHPAVFSAGFPADQVVAIIIIAYRKEDGKIKGRLK